MRLLAQIRLPGGADPSTLLRGPATLRMLRFVADPTAAADVSVWVTKPDDNNDVQDDALLMYENTAVSGVVSETFDPERLELRANERLIVKNEDAANGLTVQAWG